MSDKQWHYYHNDQIVGPVVEDELRAMLVNGALASATLVWDGYEADGGSGQWKRACEVTELDKIEKALGKVYTEKQICTRTILALVGLLILHFLVVNIGGSIVASLQYDLDPVYYRIHGTFLSPGNIRILRKTLFKARILSLVIEGYLSFLLCIWVKEHWVKAKERETT